MTSSSPAPAAQPSAPGSPAVASGHTVLVTGVAGFVGMHTVWRLLDRGHRVVGVDNLDDYYPRMLKEARLRHLAAHPRADRFEFVMADIAEADPIEAIFKGRSIDRVIHLAAQAGVRYSMIAPLRYARSNLIGTTVMLEACRHHGVAHLVYASSSSVYGDRANPPFSEDDQVDRPASFYAATKRANELMVQTYVSLYRLRATGLRLFTVYGPWGRPDMAPWMFTERVLNGQPIQVFGGGTPRRDFTFVDEATENIVRLLERPLPADPAIGDHQIVNVGSDRPVEVNGLIAAIEAATGLAARREPRPLPPGDVGLTAADPRLLERLGGRRPTIPLDAGIARFVQWYRDHPDIAATILASRGN